MMASFNQRDYLDLWAIANTLPCLTRRKDREHAERHIKRMVEECIGQITIMDCHPLPDLSE
jgi:hypothetical protein